MSTRVFIRTLCFKSFVLSTSRATAHFRDLWRRHSMRRCVTLIMLQLTYIAKSGFE